MNVGESPAVKSAIRRIWDRNSAIRVEIQLLNWWPNLMTGFEWHIAVTLLSFRIISYSSWRTRYAHFIVANEDVDAERHSTAEHLLWTPFYHATIPNDPTWLNQGLQTYTPVDQAWSERLAHWHSVLLAKHRHFPIPFGFVASLPSYGSWNLHALARILDLYFYSPLSRFLAPIVMIQSSISECGGEESKRDPYHPRTRYGRSLLHAIVQPILRAKSDPVCAKRQCPVLSLAAWRSEMLLWE